jgi:hypothetical protein
LQKKSSSSKEFLRKSFSVKKKPRDLYAGREQKVKQGSIFPSAAGNLYLKGKNKNNYFVLFNADLVVK